MVKEFEPSNPDPKQPHSGRPFPNVREPSTTPSHKAVLAVLGGCLLVAVFLVGICILGVALVYQQQQVRRAQEVARVEEERARQSQMQFKVAELREAARKAEQEASLRRQQQEAILNQERMAQAVESARQSRIEREQQKMLVQAQRGLGEVQKALFSSINMNDPDAALAPGPENGSRLSWRVHLLPALGLKALHGEFHLDESWDSEHNQSLIAKIPTVFGLEPQQGLTRIRSFLRLDGESGSHTRVGDVFDGLDQTVLLFLVGEQNAIPWTQPDNVQEIAVVTPETVGLAQNEPLRYTLCGYQTVWTAKQLSPLVLQALSTPAGGEHLDDKLIAGVLSPEEMAFRVSTLITPANIEAIELLSKDEESRQAHQKLKRISEALSKRDQELKAQSASQPVTRSPLSWRVHLLPYLGEEALFRKFQLNQEWNSEANLPLVAAMPDVYHIGTSSGRTRFILSLPKECKRTTGQLPAAGAITDDAELTTLVYLAAPHRGVTWTKADSSDPISATFQQSLGWPDTTTVVAATFAGSTAELPGNLHPGKVAALTSTGRGETFDLQLALSEPEQPLRLAAVIRPAEPVADLITLPKQAVDPGKLKNAELPKDAARFRSLVRAVFMFNDASQRAPTQMQSSSGVRSQLSWRVHLLPFLDQKVLYEKFKLDEPWDSEHNITFLDYMPEVYRTAEDSATTTRLRVLSGKGSLFAPNRNWIHAPDGIANTIMILEAGEAHEQPWTQPDTDLEISSLDFESLFGEAIAIRALMGDGELLRFTRDAPKEVFRALATADGRELVDAATVQRWLAHHRGEALMPSHMETRWESDKMKAIVLATLNYSDVHHFLPPQQKPQRSDVSGIVPLRCSQLSWRVHILPFLGQNALYDQFRLTEPWDSPHNTQLLPSMPDCYRDADDAADSHVTRILRLMGPGTPFPEAGLAPRMRDIQDGTSQTVHFIQAPDEYSVPWTRPDDLMIDLNDSGSLDLLQTLVSTPGLKTVTFDGAVRRLAADVTAETLKGLITPSGSELLKTRDLFLEN